ncbi:hypothetical protein EMPS_02590 [Entomortierella parvispora]|uniref:OPT superfamily oligopeptide transporter n=1 Tax=Entomortierella parvispora TaxID=205924 RepID=A0A9P3LTM3_9FUNG|nr:hypothetical protein EMPS_02590 [Entomortierella parvispora]
MATLSNSNIQEFSDRKEEFLDEKADIERSDVVLEEEEENSCIEAVRAVVPITDDPSLPVMTFRFWVLSTLFSIIGAMINQYYYFRTTSGTFSIYFVNLATYGMGVAMARTLPTGSISVFGYSMSMNSGPFNIKEHCLMGIAVSTASTYAYAIDILAATDLNLKYRIPTLGSLILILTTQCLGYGMAGMLRKFLVYPAQMVWWANLVQVVFYNAMHNTDEFKSKRMIRGWSYMKFFWVICGCMFIYEFLPQWLAPMFVFMDWICWIKPFDFDFWALFSSFSGSGIMSISLDWNSIGGSTMWLPLATQVCLYGGMVLSYWIILPILWLNNIMGAKTLGAPLTPSLFYSNGTKFQVTNFMNSDHTLNEGEYNAGPPATMTPMYALNFFWSFVSLAGCVTHIAFFHGRDILDSWKASVGSSTEDIHTKKMRVYPEMPQSWYAIFYVIMVALSIFTCYEYDLQLPWWGFLIACVLGWVMTLPVCALVAITGYGPGLNVITELICGYMLPGRPIANMVFKTYGYMVMGQCQNLLQDLKLGHYMKIPPRAMFVAQFWGTIVGGLFNYMTMILIINSHRDILDGTETDPTGLWTGNSPATFWGSALIFGALGPKRMFSSEGNYGFVFYGFVLGAIIPIILWALSKKFPNVQWGKFNIALVASGMSFFPYGLTQSVLVCIITFMISQFYLHRYHKNWWNKYIFILSAALDTGAAFTGLVVFLFLGGGVSPTLSVAVPSWWANYYTPEGNNAPYLFTDRCGAFNGSWTSGTL